MTKDEQIASLLEMNAWLRSRIEILEAVRPLSSTERSRMCRQRQRTEMQRECNGDATPNVAELSTNATKVQRDATKCNETALPENERGVNGPLGVSPPEPPFPVTPLNPPKARDCAPPKINFDEVTAVDYAADKGFPQEQIGRMVDKFLNHHDAGGWKRTGGVVIKDRMAAWRTWVANELERNPPNGSSNGHGPMLEDPILKAEREFRLAHGLPA